MTAVILDEPPEVLLVALFLAEGLHRTNAGHALNEVLDQAR